MKQAILSRLPAGYPWREQLHWFDSTDSTNTQAKILAQQGAPQGTAVAAGFQSAGRGRMGRSFHSPADSGIYLSMILRPECPPQALMHLTCAVGVAMCDALEESCSLRPGIKWINDLVLQERKVGGILTELGLAGNGAVDYAIVGIGINCNQLQFPPELAQIATSVRCATGRLVDTAALTAAMLARLEGMSRELFSQKAERMDRYRRDCLTLGKQVQLHGSLTGPALALDVDEDGGLLVRLENGRIHTVQSGEVSVRGMYSYV